MLSSRWLVSLALVAPVALVTGCSHQGSAPPPEVATTSTTSALTVSSVDGRDATLAIESGAQSTIAALVSAPTPLTADTRYLPRTQIVEIDDAAIDEQYAR